MEDDYRIKGYLNGITFEDPRYPLTGPIQFRGKSNSFPLRSSLVKGLPVLPPKPARGFLHGSPAVGNFTEEDRKEQRYSLKFQEKTSAERRKKQRQQNDTQKFMEEYYKYKEEENMLKQREKEEDLRLLRSYNPFGKPGFGAPRGTGKQHAKITKAIDSQEGIGIVRAEVKHPEECENLPLPDAANRVKLPKNRLVRRYEDDRMRRYRVDRNAAEKYKKELDALMDVKQHKQKMVEDMEKQQDKGMLEYDPFGKPGAGAPNRDDKGNLKMSRKCHFSSHEKFTPTEEDNSQNLWLKLGFPPAKKKLHIPRSGDHGVYEFLDSSLEGDLLSRRHVGGGGEPLVGHNGEKLTKRGGSLQTIHGARRTENVTKVVTPEEIRRSEDRNSPWGKPGAGAPLRDSDGLVVKNTKGRIQHETLGFTQEEEETMERAKRIYREELKDGIEMQKRIKEEEKSYFRLPPGDVPSWFSKGKVGRPKRDPLTGIIVPQKRVMSDVTAQKFNTDKPRDTEKYYHDLQKMAEERYKKKLEERQRILEQELKHVETFQSYFGKEADLHREPIRRKFSDGGIVASEGEMGTSVKKMRSSVKSLMNLSTRNRIEARQRGNEAERSCEKDVKIVETARETVPTEENSIAAENTTKMPSNPQQCPKCDRQQVQRSYNRKQWHALPQVARSLPLVHSGVKPSKTRDTRGETFVSGDTSSFGQDPLLAEVIRCRSQINDILQQLRRFRIAS